MKGDVFACGKRKTGQINNGMGKRLSGSNKEKKGRNGIFSSFGLSGGDVKTGVFYLTKIKQRAKATTSYMGDSTLKSLGNQQESQERLGNGIFFGGQQKGGRFDQVAGGGGGSEVKKV